MPKITRSIGYLCARTIAGYDPRMKPGNGESQCRAQRTQIEPLLTRVEQRSRQRISQPNIEVKVCSQPEQSLRVNQYRGGYCRVTNRTACESIWKSSVMIDDGTVGIPKYSRLCRSTEGHR